MKASSKPGDYVLDPFAGSGTVAAVAARLQRKFVMIEVSQQYCELIQERLNSTQMELVPSE
jgi:site-specific DNA-methyltransferase (adenine-specific)